VRVGDWKLIRTPASKQVQLFNLKRDPWEKRNLAEKNATTVVQLDEKLHELMNNLHDPLKLSQLVAPPGPGR
jgi:hypothetical protein